MTFPKTFDAYVPSNGADFLALSTFQAEYVPFPTLQAVTTRLSGRVRSRPPVLLLCARPLHTGFPSGTPGVAQIGFEELSLRLYHTSLLHDLALLNNTEVLAHPAHAMTFELQDANDLRALARCGPQSRSASDRRHRAEHRSSQHLGTRPPTRSSWQSVQGLTPAEYFNGTGIVNYTRLWNPKTVAEIEKAYPYGDAYAEAAGLITREVTQKPNCLFSHIPGGLDGLLNNLRVGPIVPV
ncbi:hypothetical protein C8J57DRAFT_1238870 [Mycena rebaudengoi]|nr:hypothetical protein C8J57DRAFT_1238870 [Mycena rebaudengoi]